MAYVAIVKRALIVASYLLLLHTSLYSCSLSPLKEHRVSANLTVKVTHLQKPLAGIEVTLRAIREEGSEGSVAVEAVFAGETDERGEVDIKGLPIGRYFLTATHAGLDAGKAILQVEAQPSKKIEKSLLFEWADWAYQTRSVTGTLSGLIPGDTGKPLMDMLHPKETVYPGVALNLKSAFSTDEYRTVSDSSGFFLIPNVPDGIYILTIAGGMKSVSGTGDETVLVIDVSQKAPLESLRLRLKDTGCYRTEFQLEETVP